MDELLTILQDIISNIKYIDKKQDDIIAVAQELKKIYKNKDFRHSYAEISRKIEPCSSDQRTLLTDFIDEVIKYLESNHEQRYIINGLGKLADHLELESIRLDRMEEIKLIDSKFKIKSDEIDKKLNEYNTKTNRLQSQINNINTQVVTVLGIFAGLVITFSTANDMSRSILENISALNYSQIIFVILMLGFVLYNCIFIVLYMISKIIGVSLAVECRRKECEYCNKNHWSIIRLLKKYPYIFWADILLIIGMVILYFFMK